jgi:hypothetical protein
MMSFSSFRKDRLLLCLLLVSLFWHVIAAVFNEGFFHFDEHYQIIEFASAKFGITDPKDLAWEYGARLRPWLLPAAFYMLLKLGAFLGLINPFTQVFLFRLLAGALGLLTTTVFYQAVEKDFATRPQKIFLFCLLNFLWCVPFLHVHPSSESFATSFFLWGLGVAIPYFDHIVRARTVKLWPALAIGILWGLAFECRFQVAFLVLGALVWFAFSRRGQFKPFAVILTGALFIFVCGRLLDSWGYGEWTITPWNYFKVNLVHNVAAERFGRDPVWYYFTSAAAIFPPLSVLLLFLTGAGLWYFPKNLLSVTVFFFLVPHLLISHKELRFLFPIFPLLLPLCLKVLIEVGSIRRSLDRGWVWSSAVSLNLVGLLVLSVFYHAREMPFYRFVYDLKVPVLRYVAYDGDPFYPAGVRNRFYNQNVERVGLTEKPDDWHDLPRDLTHASYVAVKGAALAPPQFPVDVTCVRIFDDTPWWTRWAVAKKIAAATKLKTIQLYRCETVQPSLSPRPSHG